ncbi:hypothetical protein RUND412_006386 [Rhizina undulata]
MSTEVASNTPAESAHILLQSFTIPPIDPTTHTTLKSLTLTSDIPLSNYNDSLSTPFTIPALPPTITSLTLELFSLGYSPTFLTTLADSLESLTSLTLYSQLIAGTTAESFNDAVSFFSILVRNGLKRASLVDVFVPPDFFGAVAATLNEGAEGLKALEIDWKFRPQDDEFNERLPVTSLPDIIHPGLVSLVVSISDYSPEEPGFAPCVGMQKPLVERLLTWDEAAVEKLKLLNLSAVAVEVGEVESLWKLFTGLVVGVFTVRRNGTGKEKEEILGALGELVELEEVEVFTAPSLALYSSVRKDRVETLMHTLFSKSEVEALAKKLPKLKKISSSVLRRVPLGYSTWAKSEDGTWSGEFSVGADLSEKEKERIREIEEESREKIVEVEA